MKNLKSLKNCIRLSSQVKIYVPSTIDVDTAIDNEAIVDKTLEFLCNFFGGATASKNYGAWLSASGKVVKEKVTECLSFCDQAKLEEHIDSVYDYCLRLKEHMKQEAIALEVNGELYFV